MDDRNAYFQLSIREDGTYLKLFPAVGNGDRHNLDIIQSYLFRQEIFNYSNKVLKNAINAGNIPEIKLTNDIAKEVDEQVTIDLMMDYMTATATFYPPSEGGKLLTISSVEEMIFQSGVSVGLDLDLIKGFFKDRRYLTPFVIAKGIEPVEGTEGHVEYKFKTEKSLTPKINSDGTVDFHSLDNINNIGENELIAELVPTIPGENGTDVTGKEVRCRDITKARIKCGKNIEVTPDGLSAYSKTKGHVYLVGDVINLSTVYEIASDVDSSTGDIDFNGDVVIRGSILTGYSVKAGGNVSVDGVVEGAVISAGGNVIIKRGIQGMKKGTISAGGDVAVKFIENAYVISEGAIHTETIMHSNVTAKGKIEVTAKKGFVVGGRVRSSIEIKCRTAGSVMETATILQVGTNLESEEEFKEIRVKMYNYRMAQEDCLKVLRMYKQKVAFGYKLSDEKVQFVRELVNKNRQLTDRLKELQVQHDGLKRFLEADDDAGGRVIIEGAVKLGVKIVIEGAVYYVRQEMYCSVFEKEKSDIIVSSAR